MASCYFWPSSKRSNSPVAGMSAQVAHSVETCAVQGSAPTETVISPPKTLECYICKDDESKELLLMQTCVCKAIVHKSCLEKWILTHKSSLHSSHSSSTECSICKRPFQLVPQTQQQQESKCCHALKRCMCNPCVTIILYCLGSILVVSIFLALSWLIGWLILSRYGNWQICVLIQLSCA